MADTTDRAKEKKEVTEPANDELWINPVGGYGDILMLSGVLKLVHDQDPEIKFNLVRRTKYTTLLKGHPAIRRVGFPPKDAKFVDMTYWSAETYESGKYKAFQLLAEKFQ